MFGQLDDEQLIIQRTIRRFAAEHILPYASDWDDTSHFPQEIVPLLAEMGLCGIAIPEELGGSGLNRLTGAVIYEALASTDLSTAVWLSVHNMVAGIVYRFGTPEQQLQWLPDLVQGRSIGAFSLSEADAGSDPAGMKATARRDGNEYVINGSKMWVTSGDVAGLIVVMVRTGSGKQGISAFVVAQGTPGLAVGKIERKMGLHSSHTAELIFDECRVPMNNLLGSEGQGLAIALSSLDAGRINIAASANGVSQAAIDIATQYAAERQQFGKAIAEFQGIQFMLSDMHMNTEAARLLTYRAAAVLDNAGKATSEAAMAKCFSTDTAMAVTTNAVQILGGAGYTKDYPLERFMRDIKVTQIFEGTNQIQRIVIARHLLSAISATKK